MKRGLQVSIFVILFTFRGTWAIEPEFATLKRHVTTLAGSEFGGRRAEGAKLAREYVIKEFQRSSLKPLFGESFLQEVTDGISHEIIGINVGAMLPPTNPKFADEWVILAAHYDHLGTIGGVVYPGADDNASGVAMMLEVARTLAQTPIPPDGRRGIMFVGFDLEERGPKGEFGLRGSQFFANHPPRPIGQVRLFVTADMIGRSLGGVCQNDVFVLGSEHEPAVRPWIARAAVGKAVTVNTLGADVLVIDRSDYGPFRSRQIPYLFFTTGENPLYHSPRDVAATIDYEKLTAISQIMAEVVRSAVEADQIPKWAPEPNYSISEALAFRHVFQTLLDHRADLKINAYQTALIKQAIQVAQKVIDQQSMSSSERNIIVRTAQIVLFTVF